MNMYYRLGIALVCWMACLTVTGCGSGPRQDAAVLQLIFDDAKGISRGDPVVVRGIQVGHVSAPAMLSQDGKQVLVTITIDKLPENLQNLLTAKTRASIKRDLLGIKGTFVELTLPEQTGEKLVSGAILTNSAVFNPASWLTWPPEIEIPADMSLPQWLADKLLPGKESEIGKLPYFINIFALIMLAVVMVSIILDGLIRLTHGSRREKPSLKIFQSIWSLFVLSILAKVMVILLQLFFMSGERAFPAGLTPWMVPVDGWPALIQPDFTYWVIVVLMIIIRFKFDLLVRRVRDCD